MLRTMTIILPIILMGCALAPQRPPLACRVPVPHANYASVGQERAQLDQANNLLQFCMAQWDQTAGRSIINP